jgi:hypothetical protein
LNGILIAVVIKDRDDTKSSATMCEDWFWTKVVLERCPNFGMARWGITAVPRPLDRYQRVPGHCVVSYQLALRILSKVGNMSRVEQEMVTLGWG